MKHATLLAILILPLCIVNTVATGTVSNLGSEINTPNYEANPFVTSNGQILYFDRAGDIYHAAWAGTHWSVATPIPGVNTTSYEVHPWVIGNHMYFATDRWTSSWRLALATYGGGSWGNVIQLPMSNTSNLDSYPSVTADESTMFFFSSRSPNYGAGDIFKATYTGGIWTNIENLGTIINTSAEENCPSISPDGNTLHFIRSSIYVYESQKIGGTWSTPQLLPDMINDGESKYGLCYRPELQKLYFGDGRSGGGYGLSDLWQCSSYNVQVEPLSLGQLRSLYHK
jgi:hypothetical protein